MRIFDEADIEKAFRFAQEHKDAPTLLEFIIEDELNVSPMVPTGNSLSDMIMDC